MNSPKKYALPTLNNLKIIQSSYGQRISKCTHQTIKKDTKKIIDTKLLSQTQIEQAKQRFIANQEKQKQMQKSLPPILKRKEFHQRSVSVSAPKTQYSKYFYFIGEGNNHQLIKKLLDERQNWVQVKDPKSKKINFKWQETEKGYEYQTINQKEQPIQMLNHFEFHSEISDKFKLAVNFKAYCDKNRLNIYDYIPTTFVIECTNENLKSELFQFISFYRQNCPQHKLPELDKTIKQYFFSYTTLYDNKVNHYPTLFGNENLWIFKPSNMNQGRGIHVVRSLQEVLDIQSKYQGGYKEKLLEVKRNEQNEIINKVVYLNTLVTEQFVIQKYIEKPLLINDRKFDIRAYILLTSNLQIYFYREGQLRLATEKFDTKVQSNYVHLTNNAIQYTHPEYGKSEEGNQYSFDQAQNIFKKDFRKDILGKIKTISYTAFQTVKHKINKQKRKNCFEIFGMDFIIDEQYTPWLIEVNTNPSLEVTSKLLDQLFARMVNDAFRITIDLVFPQTEPNCNYPLMNYKDDENLWDSMGYLQS
ncbi:unnamed protein product [Paramecium primaurelia]|uniref:Tubulin-tyrosine ligase family protein n=1 Tax=Paramecium primaurelia TaxID=5886 RepID=A0A8S1NWL5_PARPR|nr:unnamed protein product [Paramecium primaurelia]